MSCYISNKVHLQPSLTQLLDHAALSRQFWSRFFAVADIASTKTAHVDIKIKIDSIGDKSNKHPRGEQQRKVRFKLKVRRAVPYPEGP